jgi:hypothetical protein
MDAFHVLTYDLLTLSVYFGIHRFEMLSKYKFLENQDKEILKVTVPMKHLGGAVMFTWKYRELEPT